MTQDDLPSQGPDCESHLESLFTREVAHAQVPRTRVWTWLGVGVYSVTTSDAKDGGDGNPICPTLSFCPGLICSHQINPQDH